MVDAIFTIGGIIFAIGLLPACLNPETRIPLKTSLPTASVLFVYTVTFACMDLPFSTFTSWLTASMWGFIACRRKA